MTRHGRMLLGGLCAVLVALAVGACGSSSSSHSTSSAAGGATTKASSDPQALLRQTFARSHAVKSGVLDFDFVINPKGSSVLTTPISVDLHGPFEQKGGADQTPLTDLTVTASGLGKKGSFGVVTTANAAFVRLQGAAYALPRSSSAQLRKALGAKGSKSSTPGLSSLGIDPANWLSDPKIVGTETVDGTETEHLRAGIDVKAMLADVNKALAKESSSLGDKAHALRISPATAAKIAAAIKHPTFDVWTGKDDSTLRKLSLAASVPITGEISTRLGGMTSADFRLGVAVTGLNQPQTITAPAHPRSYAQLQTKLQALLPQLRDAFGGSMGSGSSGSGSTGSGSSGAQGATSKYAKCINSAGGDVTKMQKCASLLNSAGG